MSGMYRRALIGVARCGEAWPLACIDVPLGVRRSAAYVHQHVKGVTSVQKCIISRASIANDIPVGRDAPQEYTTFLFHLVFVWQPSPIEPECN